MIFSVFFFFFFVKKCQFSNLMKTEFLGNGEHKEI